MKTLDNDIQRNNINHMEEKMSFIDDIIDLRDKIASYQEQHVINNEESTKRFLIIPFLKALGYNTDNPFDFRPEYCTDTNSKYEDRIDYAIFDNGVPVILIEAKACTEPIEGKEKIRKQLHHYFGSSKAKLGILTNGVVYHFFTDLEQANIMDKKPFFVFNLLESDDQILHRLRDFTKENFLKSDISQHAKNLMVEKSTKEYLLTQLENPDPDFINFLLKRIETGGLLKGRITSKITKEYTETIKKAMKMFIMDRLQTALQDKQEQEQEKQSSKDTDPVKTVDEEQESGIITTDEEIGAFNVVQMLLRDHVDVNRIQYKDTKSYFVIYVDSKSKWLCRIYVDARKKRVVINTRPERMTFEFEHVSEIANHRAELEELLRQHLTI